MSNQDSEIIVAFIVSIISLIIFYNRIQKIK